MLCIKRRIGEGVLLPGGVRVVRLSRGRIGIEAPSTVKVLRDELAVDANGICPHDVESVLNDRYQETGNPVG